MSIFTGVMNMNMYINMYMYVYIYIYIYISYMYYRVYIYVYRMCTYMYKFPLTANSSGLSMMCSRFSPMMALLIGEQTNASFDVLILLGPNFVVS